MNSQKLTSLFANIPCSFLDLIHHPQVHDQETRTKASSRPRGTAISETVDKDRAAAMGARMSVRLVGRVWRVCRWVRTFLSLSGFLVNSPHDLAFNVC
jgi:hypothetical protein